MNKLEYTLMGKTKTIQADRIEGEIAYIRLLGSADFTTGKRAAFINYRQYQNSPSLFFELDSFVANERITKNSDQSIRQWLSSQGFEFKVGEFDDPEEGYEAVQNAVSNYGEGILRTRFFQHYLEMIRRCYDPSHPRYAKEGAIGIRVCKEWLEDFGTYVENMSEAPGTKEAGVDRMRAQLRRSSALLARCLED